MRTILASVTAGALLAALAMAQPPSFTLRDLGTLPGGTFSIPGVLSQTGVVTGVSGAPDGTQHAVVWQGSQIIDIGVPGLGGPNSAAFGESRGVVVGQADSPTIDPNQENFCGFGSPHMCLPFRWQNGVMTALPLLPGGNNGGAGPINVHGEISGTTETGTIDPECSQGIAPDGSPSPQVLDYKGVVWGSNSQIVRMLEPLGGDTVSLALWINDVGQSVGVSGRCRNVILPPLAAGPHSVLWEKDGSVQDIGNLGSTTLNVPLAVNNRGQVVGGSGTAPDSTPQNGVHAFLWTKQTGIHDLGILPGDVVSIATAISDAGGVVGASFDANGMPSAVVWHDGIITDLNDLIPQSSLYLAFAAAINNTGEIAGWGLDRVTGEMHAFLATPTGAIFGGASLTPAQKRVRPAAPGGFDKLLRGRIGMGRR